MPAVIQKLIDMKISVVTIVGWVVALIGLTFTGATAYGEQKQKLLYLAERQTKIEITIDRIESLQRDMNLALTRMEVRMNGKEKKQ